MSRTADGREKSIRQDPKWQTKQVTSEVKRAVYCSIEVYFACFIENFDDI
jgi:hypothetical protein